MSILKSGISGLFSFLLVLSITLAVIGTAAGMFLEPQTYIETLEKADVYDSISSQFEEGSGIPIQSIDPDAIKSILDGIILDVFEYINGETDALSIKVDVGPYVEDFFVSSAQNFRVCDEGELPFDGEEVICRPAEIDPDTFLDDVLSIHDRNLGDFSSTEVDVVDLYGLEFLDDVQEGVTYYKVGLSASYILSVVLLSFIIILNRTSIKSTARWVGVSFLVSGIIGLAIGFFVKGNIRSFIPSSVDSYITYVDIALGVVFEFFDRIIAYEGIIFALGLVLVIFSILWKEKS